MASSIRIFFIRHGETVDNVASIYAGVRDSPLTVHGTLQATRLASYLSERNLTFQKLYSSDLQRARLTAQKIADAQNAAQPAEHEQEHISVTQLPCLRELDFGSLEGKKFSDKLALARLGDQDLPGDFVPQETKASMDSRMDEFLERHLVPYILSFQSDDASTKVESVNIAVVSHGMILSRMWKRFIMLLPLRRISFGPKIDESTFPPRWTLDRLGAWSNTGFLEICLTPLPTEATDKEMEFNIKSMEEGVMKQVLGCIPLHKFMLKIEAINEKEHLTGLKRQRGGVGSSRHDEKQKGLDSFFKKVKK